MHPPSDSGVVSVSSRLRSRARSGARRLPEPVRVRARAGLALLPSPARQWLGTADAADGPRATRPRWGNLRSLRPFSYDYGWDRGSPVDRVAIDAFHAAHAEDIRGACLEVLDAHYTTRHGGASVTSCDVLDIDPENTEATVLADLGVPDSLPRQRYDCVVLTQTLHLIPDYEAALRNVYDALRSGGTALVTVPTVSPHNPAGGLEHDLWRFTPAGLEHEVTRLLPDAAVSVRGYGNLITCVAFLHGIVAEELGRDELHAIDPRFPLLAAARVAKPAGPR